MNYCIACDIGGTNARFALCKTPENPTIILETTIATKSVGNLPRVLASLVKEAKANHGARVSAVCVAIAGPTFDKHTRAYLSNGNITISAKEIKKTTRVNTYIINDFEANAYALQYLPYTDKNKVIVLSKTKRPDFSNTVGTIGAGTGLGQSILLPVGSRHIAVSSEGGNTDVPIQNKEEFDLVQYLRRNRSSVLVYEDIVSGHGIEGIYFYLSGKRKSAAEIAQAARTDKHCRQTMLTFTKFYARAVRSFIVYGNTYGGIVVCGGIAAKNPWIFKTKEFKRELYQPHTHLKEIKSTPLFINLDEFAGIKGAAYVAFKGL